MSYRPNLTERGFCKDVPAPALTTLLSPRPLCANPFQSWQTPLRLLILLLACLSTTTKCHWIQHGNMATPQLLDLVGTHVPVF